MSFEIKGKIIEIYDLVAISDRFKKREFVIENSENNGGFEFVNSIKFQLTQDRTNQVDGFKNGDEVKVSFNVRGKKWEKDGKVSYFTNLDAWKIENVSNNNDSPPPPPSPNPEFDEAPPEKDDDLPF